MLVLVSAVGVAARTYPQVFKMKDIVGCTEDDLTTANSVMDSWHECTDGVYGPGDMDKVADAMEAEQYVLAAKTFLETTYETAKAKTAPQVSGPGCTCTQKFVDRIPACGDLGKLKGNMTLLMPYCDVAKTCPSIDVLPMLETFSKCYNESYDNLCGEGGSMGPDPAGCLAAAEPLFKTAYVKTLFDCNDQNTDDFPLKQLIEPFGVKLEGFFEESQYKQTVHEWAKRFDEAQSFEDFHERFCKVYNYTRDIDTDYDEDDEDSKKGPECESVKDSRVIAEGAIHRSIECLSHLFDGVPPPDIKRLFEVFIDHNDTQPQVQFTVDILQNIYDKHPNFASGACSCARAALDDFPKCDVFKVGADYLQGLSDTCSVVDLCPQYDMQLFLDVGKKCKFGRKAEEDKDAILDSLCDADKGDSECAAAVEKIFTEHMPQELLKCLVDSAIDWDQIVADNPLVPDGQNITNLLKQILESDAVLKYSTFTNLGCALLYNPDDEDYSYNDEDWGSDNDYYYLSRNEDEEKNKNMLLAGGALMVFAAIAFVTMRPGKTTIVSAADEEDGEGEDEGDGKMMEMDAYDEDKRGLIDDEDEEI